MVEGRKRNCVAEMGSVNEFAALPDSIPLSTNAARGSESSDSFDSDKLLSRHTDIDATEDEQTHAQQEHTIQSLCRPQTQLAG